MSDRSPLARLLLAPALLAGALAAQPAPAVAASPARPNVLLILADDLGFSDLGCYGGELATPELDALARGGVRLSAFYTSARCCPSRASLLTGLHPHEAGVGSFATARPRERAGPAYTGHLLDSCATLAELLGDAGYSTWMVGKWHLGEPGPIARGFQAYDGFADPLAYSADQWDPSRYVRLAAGAEPVPARATGAEPFYATDAFFDSALEFLAAARRQQRPWFLYVACSAPHFPLQAPQADIDRLAPVYRRGWDALRAERFARMQQLGLVPAGAELPPRALVPVDRDDIANGYSGLQNPAWDELPPARREDLARRMATFAAMVEHVDRGVGRLTADLRAHAELRHTLILFLSDNGACYEWGPFGFDGPSRRGETTLHEGAALARIGQPGTWQSYGSAWANLCNTPLSLYKHFCHEGGLASPLIVHWPAGVPAREAWLGEPAHLMDIVPTVLEAVGARYPRERAGRALTPPSGLSLLPVLRSGGSLSERSLAFEHQGARALRRGRFKVVFGKRMPEPARWELYDLAADRSELHDLAAARPELTAELVAEWEAWARRVGAEPFERSDRPPAPPAPQIAGRALTVRCRFDTLGEAAATGVLVAQGGRQHGFALHLVAGVPTFDVRRAGRVTRLRAAAPVHGELELTAELTATAMTIRCGDRVLATGPSPGLIDEQPIDRLDVGEDRDTAAGDYVAPNRFAGRILDAAVDAQL
ncbi:MAG: arylsulfatase [Planctomycetes bacterium]|nr:arylsulfatase [Planctomycetota bacterium]